MVAGLSLETGAQMFDWQIARFLRGAVRHPRFSIYLVIAAILITPTSSLAFDPSDLIIGTDDLYGFTSGSDLGDAGARAVAVGSTWAFGKSAGRFRATH